MTKKVLIIPTIRPFPLYQWYPDFPGEVWFVGSKDDVNPNCPKDRFIGRKERVDFLRGDASYEMETPGLSRIELSIAYLMAYAEGFDLIYTLDDDTLPLDADFFEIHEERMDVTYGWNRTNKFVSPLEESWFPRGFPYKYRDDYKETATFKENNVKVMFNLGLWYGVPDINFADYNKLWFGPNTLPFSGDGITQNYIPLCTMNICFRAELAPVYLQPPFPRYDDIFSGFILSKLFQGTDEYISFGSPYVMHLRQPGNRNYFIYLQNQTLPIIEMLPDALDMIKLPEAPRLEQYTHIAKQLPIVWKWIGRSVIKDISKSMLRYALIAQKL
jgi:hypothetical protein